MRTYKAERPVAEHRLVVRMLLALALTQHSGCVARLARIPVTHWCVVPSLPAKERRHPLRELVAEHVLGQEISLISAQDTSNARALNAEHFTCAQKLLATSHVLLVDDTWVTGDTRVLPSWLCAERAPRRCLFWWSLAG